MNYSILDKICDHQSHRAVYNLHSLDLTEWDSFYRWVADLGRREGVWIRERHGV
jgi:hypothetical protein